MATYVGRSHVNIYIFVRMRLFGLYLYWVPWRGQIISETWIRTAGEVIYISFGYVFGLYFITLTYMTATQYHRCHQNDIFCLFYYILIHIYQICTLWTEIQGYPSHTICVTCMGYILLLLICVYLPLTSKTGWCWNLLESSPARIPLIELSHKWTWILFIILNSKAEIWICSHPTIYANSQSNFYDVLTLYHTILCTELCGLWIPSNPQTTYSEHILHIIPSYSSSSIDVGTVVNFVIFFTSVVLGKI